jgi:hypothetical protein
MASKQKIVANQANAKKSTGPRSAEGKAVSRMNALQHGIVAGTVPLLPWEDPDQRAQFDQAIEVFYQPTTIVEAELVRQIGSLLWRLRRVEPAETAIVASRMLEEIEEWACPATSDQSLQRADAAQAEDVCLHPLLSYGRALVADAAHGSPLARLTRYETSITNALLKLMSELDGIQASQLETGE